jgi:hypothetical protein
MKKIFFLSICCATLHMPSMLLAWECDVTVSGPKTIKLEQQITLSATGTPAGGAYSWSRTPNLIPHGSTATLTGFEPTFSEHIKVLGYYTTPKGKKCSDTKWIWACICSMNAIQGQSTARIQEETELRVTAVPAGGSFLWTVNSGTGTLTQNGSSAIFVGDKDGPVEIKVSYTPHEGGEPCTQYHTIAVKGECNVTLTGDMYQRQICRPVDFHALGTPAGGTYTWMARNSIKYTGSEAIYTEDRPGNDNIVVAYTSPDGTTCEANKNILSYTINFIGAIPYCFESGATLLHDDFAISTTPAGFQNNVLLSPTSFSTLQQTETTRITASLMCDQDSPTASTLIKVVNEKQLFNSEFEIEIPNLLTDPLKAIGLADKLEFNLSNKYTSRTKCCDEGWPVKSTSGQTSITAAVDLEDIPIYGVPLPKAIKKYFTFNALQADLKAEGAVNIQKEPLPCQEYGLWQGGGVLSVGLGLGTVAKVKTPYVLIRGEVKGETEIEETLTVTSDQITAKGEWRGIIVDGIVKIRIGSIKIKAFNVSHQIFRGSATPAVTINLTQ